MRVKVWNDNPHTDWKETFKGDEINIKSGTFIEMEFFEAHEFKGQYSPIRLKPDETQDPKSFKMIRVEPLTQEKKDTLEEDGQEIFPCQLCKKVYTTEASLLKHSILLHADKFVTDELAEAELPKRKGRPPNPKTEAQAE